jgi:hypothetical protein
MIARIHRPAKTAMQSGRAKSDRWALDFQPAEPEKLDPLMGWISSGDTSQQVRIFFESREEAIAYAKAEGLVFEVIEPNDRKRIIKTYADNFSFARKQPWTH